jgi:hypothetical protein
MGVAAIGRAKNKKASLPFKKESVIGKRACVCASRGLSVCRLAED